MGGTASEDSTAIPVVEERSVDVPTKVFIERETTGYEYSFDDPRIAGYLDALFEGYYCDQNFMELFYALPEVFAPVHEIASRVADANWQLKKSWNDEVDYGNADFNRLFSQPNPLVSFKDFVYQAVCYELLTGKQFFYVNKPGALALEPMAATVAWWNLPAHRTRAVIKEGFDPYTATTISDFVLRYEAPVNGKNRVFDVDKVLPLWKLSLAAAYNINKAESPLKGASKAIRNLIPVYEARGIIYIKRGALGFMVSKKGDEGQRMPLTKTEREQLNKDADATYGVTRGKSTIGITDVPVEFVRTAMSIKELEPFEETLADAVAIYAVLRVPRHLVPSKDQSTYANAASDMKSFYSDVIMPWAERLAQAWTNFFQLEGQRRYVYPDFAHVAVLQENRKEKAEVDKTNGVTYQQRWLHGACSLNDWIVANDGDKVPGNPLYEKKLLELTPEELDQVKAVINIKSNAKDTSPEDTGDEAPGIGGQLQ